MTAGRLGKEQRAKARLLFFVFNRSYYTKSGGDHSTKSLSRQLG